MRLFDADEFLKKLAHSPLIQDAMRKAFDHMPTIEAEPIKHGHWILSKDRYWKTCSECGADVDVSMGNGIFVHAIEVDEINYCPNCGAKMVGRDKRK